MSKISLREVYVVPPVHRLTRHHRRPCRSAHSGIALASPAARSALYPSMGKADEENETDEGEEYCYSGPRGDGAK